YELRRIVESGGVVAGDHLRHGRQGVARKPCEPVAQARVQTRPLTAGEARIAGIAEQCMAIRVARPEDGILDGPGHEGATSECSHSFVAVLDVKRVESSEREPAPGNGSSTRNAPRGRGQVGELSR